MTEAYEMISKTELEGLRARLAKLEAVVSKARAVVETHGCHTATGRQAWHPDLANALAALDEKEPS